MKSVSFPYRQVHLDFHTYGDLPEIGKNFSKEGFQEALKLARLDSITVFAKCNQGYCYYPTKVGEMHPGLAFDLTKAMIEAAHEIGVRAPVYINAGLSEAQAPLHPEWWSYREKPESEGGSAIWGGEFTLLCLNDGSYAERIYALTEEVCKRYSELDGLFFDIALVGRACYCKECLAGMRKMGLDPSDPEAAQHYYRTKRKAFMTRCREILFRYHPDATVFFNSGGADQYRPEYHEFSTHFEMEDLPTAWGGYHKLPFRAKYFAKKEKPYLAMTGKFHLNWGEFGGYKSKEALKYEICSMATFGAGCSVGDHLHPDGMPERQTYENIGYAYEYLERIAPFCYGGTPTARLGVYLSPIREESLGISQLLLDLQIDFEMVTPSDLADFDTVILPDGIVLEEDALQALQAYLARGGKLLFFGGSLVKDGAFQVSAGASYRSVPPADCDYLLCKNAELPSAPLLSYYCGHDIEGTDGKVLSTVLRPRFCRTAQPFCDLRQVPFSREGEQYPSAVKKGNVIYSAHPLGLLYQKYGSGYYRNYFRYLLTALGFESVFSVEGLGSTGRAAMIRQAEQNRYCLNLTYAVPIKRGMAEVIEDLMPVFNVRIRLRVKERICRAYSGVSGEAYPVTASGGEQQLLLPSLSVHDSIVLEY